MSFTITSACTGCGLCVRYCPVKAIQGERRQLHVIDPQLCIECSACGRVCAFKAVRDGLDDPVVKIAQAEWLHPEWQEAECVACNICVQACPLNLIRTSIRNGKTGIGLYPHLEEAKRCLGCSFCEEACPLGVIQMVASQNGSFAK